MSEITWIKIAVGMFDNEKIDYIESLPDADAILIIWIKLLTLAGKSNSGGYILLAEKIPYNAEMLAHKFRRPLNTVKMALATFEHLKMLEVDELNRIEILNWEKYQNIDGMERIREQNRLRKQRQRERQNLLPVGIIPENDSDGVCDLSRDVTQQKKSKKENINPISLCSHRDSVKKNSRYYGTNPRAMGTNPRAKEQKQAEIDRMVRLLSDPTSHHCDRETAKVFVTDIKRQKLSENTLKMLVEIQYLHNFSPQTNWAIAEFEDARASGDEQAEKLWKQVGEVIEQAKEAIRCRTGSGI